MVHAVEDTAPTGVRRIDAPAAHTAGRDGAGVVVAVIDTGIELDHPDLPANIHPTLRRDCTGTNDTADDDQGHGTHVAGTIAAEQLVEPPSWATPEWHTLRPAHRALGVDPPIEPWTRRTMSLTERERHDAYEALHAAFGDSTDTVIRMFRTEHEDLATKDDLALTRAELRTETAGIRTEMAEFRTELKTEMGELRTELKTEMGELRTELKTEMGELRTELKTEMGELRTELKTEMAQLRVQFSNDITAAFAAQTRAMTIALVASVILIALTNTLTVLVG